MKRPVAALVPLLLVSLAQGLLGGCYLLRQAGGQIHILLHQRDIDSMLVDPEVPAATREKLKLVLELKEFGERVMRLAPSRNYTTYYDTGGKPITWIVSACPKDRFEAYTWWFPIVGDVPYKGFFDPEDATAEAKALEREGYDVSVRPTAAYSTLGYFTDPVLSTMIDDPVEYVASLILHELTHGTLYLPGGTEFNEGLASFVGWQGALEFARWRFGIETPEYGRTVRAFAREERRDQEAKELFGRLDALYRSDLPRDLKLARRDEISRAVSGARRREAARLQDEMRDLAAQGAGEEELRSIRERLSILLPLPERRVNNAEILMERRYGRYEEFRALFEECGGSWPRFFAAARDRYKE